MTKQIHEKLQNYWRESGFETMTEIQSAIMPLLLNNESLIAISPTGTGKTLAYLLPVLSSIKSDKTLQVMILAPSQELVIQIHEVAKVWGSILGIKTLAILGNANIKRQIEALKEKPEVIVATPGRLVELANQSKKLKFHQIKTIIFDEADHLLEEEQAESVQEILKRVMRDTQQIWISATYGQSLQQHNLQRTKSLKVVDVTNTIELLLEHIALIAPNRQKIKQLKSLAQIENMQALVFFEQVNELETVAAKLLYEGVKVATLHSQLSKLERQHAIKAIKNNEIIYLLTTDVAARGLDIEWLPCVIHYNKVNDHRIYTHRSGRTGRMGREGTVISLVNEQELRDLHEVLKNEVITIKERVLYNGVLMTYEQREAEREVMVKTKEKNKSNKKKVPHKQNHKQTIKAKKKNRQRDTKNKGKRKHKEESK